MLFTAKLVEDQPAGKIMIRIAVVGVVFIFLGMLLPSLQDIVPFFIIGLVLSIVVMAIITKGGISAGNIFQPLPALHDRIGNEDKIKARIEAAAGPLIGKLQQSCGLCVHIRESIHPIPVARAVYRIIEPR